MNILAIALQLLPLVRGVVSVLDPAGKSGVPDVVAYAESLIPIAQDLVKQVDTISGQLPADQLVIWNSVRSDYMAAVGSIPWLAGTLGK